MKGPLWTLAKRVASWARRNCLNKTFVTRGMYSAKNPRSWKAMVESAFRGSNGNFEAFVERLWTKTVQAIQASSVRNGQSYSFQVLTDLYERLDSTLRHNRKLYAELVLLEEKR